MRSGQVWFPAPEVKFEITMSSKEFGNGAATASLGVPQDPSAREHQSRRAPALIAGTLVGVAAIVVAVLVLSSGGGVDAKAAYEQKLGASLTPLVSANGQLSNSLLALSGRGTAARA